MVDSQVNQYCSIDIEVIFALQPRLLLNMEAAKDLLKRAVELDKSEKYSEALICYEEGIQNLLRAMEGRLIYMIDLYFYDSTDLRMKLKI